MGIEKGGQQPSNSERNHQGILRLPTEAEVRRIVSISAKIAAAAAIWIGTSIISHEAIGVVNQVLQVHNPVFKLGEQLIGEIALPAVTSYLGLRLMGFGNYTESRSRLSVN